MKANAPEKLYIDFRDRKESTWRCAYTEKVNANDIEYVHTNAFIKKACDWLSDNLQTIVDVDCPSEHHVESIPALGSITQTEFLRKFREEIKYLFD